ncbi:MAG: sulfatase [Opitutaceae bacterium]|nr:sulfatase [Opitutaceae bacterium]|tara:strand:- start:2224 stop:3657 length:1434 start_codon:yes stop_codon:yes gene_type:complete
MNYHPDLDFEYTRREFLNRCGMGFGALTLGSILGSQATGSESEGYNAQTQKIPHFKAKSKRIIQIMANGGPSQVDTFDPKPLLNKWHGKPLPTTLRTERTTGAAFGSPFEFKPYGENGTEVSELFPHVGECIDDICLIRSMYTNVPNHEPSLLLMNCGDARLPRPSMGSWLTYGLGTENENLPGFVVLCPNGFPVGDSANWQNAFLPGSYQGTYIDTKHKKIEKLLENIQNDHTGYGTQRKQLDALNKLNKIHAAQRAEDDRFSARVQSFELAYRMQMEATDAFDISKEPKYIREMYGEGQQARQILIARRLAERGVRFVQVWTGFRQPWDTHDDLESEHRRLAGESDKPIAALLKDLKMRGLLDDTLVIWGGEFGRTPVVELSVPGANQGKVNGRDHNNYGFSMWMAGGGARGGYVHGATDEFGFQAVEAPVHVHDLQATILHLMGFDHEKLTYRYAGRDFRLTDVHGNVIHELIA